MMHRLGWLVVLLALAATTACVRLPSDGPVVTVSVEGTTRSTGESNYTPKSPEAGDSPAAIVEGFINAMTAIPIRTDVAKEFLSEDALHAWRPERRIITFESRSPPGGMPSEVTVPLTGLRWVDASGTWRGKRGDGRRVMKFPMTVEDGQARIAKAPNALIVDELFFQENYRQASVYFFDPSASILVPEPVFVPNDDQLSTALVNSLVAGPAPRLDDVVRSFIPPTLKPGLSVPVNEAGVAEITLNGDADQLTSQAADLMVTQLAFTLKQDPSIEAFEVTIGDQPLTLSGGDTRFSVDRGSEVAPYDVRASSLLFAVHDGVLESGAAGQTTPVTGPLGSTGFDLGRTGVSLTAHQVASVSKDGTSVLVAPVSTQGQVRQVVSGAEELLRPAWDFANRMWLIDRTSAGARVSYVEGTTIKSVPVAGLTGTDVKHFLVSRDGSRLVAALHGPRSDHLVVSRIRHDSSGRVLGVSRARSVPWNDTDVQRVRDIGWRSPTNVAVLHLLTKGVSQVVTISIDGSPTVIETYTQREGARALVSSPVPNERLYTMSRTQLYDPSDAGGGNYPLPAGVDSVHYVG
jgi:hypothetical protein